MGTSYVKAANRPDLGELIIYPANPWEYAEKTSQAILHDFGELLQRITRIEDE